MCGIAGLIDFSKQEDKCLITKMTDALSHRGPDDSDYITFDTDKYNLSLGHRRLSIIDLSPLGKQPMTNLTGRYTIVFNGEIYNYKEIRKLLIAKGYQFSSETDTEVILNSYAEWGVSCVRYFVGMFAFVVFDKVKNSLILVRDRAGVKPLYYYWDNKHFLFASELKSFYSCSLFEKKINSRSFFQYLLYSYVPAPATIFSNTYKLEPGHYLEFDLEKNIISKEKYWDVLDYYEMPKHVITEDQALYELESKLKKAFEYRMVSDVPVGLFLSGGYDSTLVSAILQKDRAIPIKTFTIRFVEEKYNEAVYARAVAKQLGTDHYEMTCTEREAQKIIHDLPYIYDEPFGDSSAIPTVLLSHFARNYVNVSISADGGDELFAGYNKYRLLIELSRMINSCPVLLRKILGNGLKLTPPLLLNSIFRGRNISSQSISKYSQYIGGKIDLLTMADFTNHTSMPLSLKRLCTQPVDDYKLSLDYNRITNINSPLSQMLSLDYLSYLPGDILTKIDRASMSASLEAREPLLDHTLIEWTARLPDKLKYNENTSKYLLKKIVHKYVPEKIMSRPKMGFSVPVSTWFRNDLKYLFDYYFSKPFLSRHGLIETEDLNKILKSYYLGDESHFALLWSLLMFQMWYDRWN